MMSNRTLLIFATLSLGGCAALNQFMTGPRTTVMIPTPAESHEATRIRRIAVLPFTGKEGAEFATEVQGVLANVKVNEVPYFSVADRSMNDRIFEEIKLTQSGLVGRDQALRLGRLLGVKGLYTGTTGNVISSQSAYQESRANCNDAKTKIFSTCKNPVTTTVSCSRQQVTYAFSPKLIDAETGQVIYARNIAKTAVGQSCRDATTPAPSVEQLAGEAKQQALQAFVGDVAPSYRATEIQLLDASTGLDEAGRNKLSQGIAFAVGRRLDRACALWEELGRSTTRSAALFYDLGVCAEASGDNDKALQLYTQADRLLDKPDEHISQALVRARQAKRNSVRFIDQTN